MINSTMIDGNNPMLTSQPYPVNPIFRSVKIRKDLLRFVKLRSHVAYVLHVKATQLLVQLVAAAVGANQLMLG